MIKLVGYVLFFFVQASWALVPVEGLLLGEAYREFQNDPLEQIFTDINYSKTIASSDIHRVKYYQHSFQNGLQLAESCTYLTPVQYGEKWKEVQAKRALVSGLQYIGLDATIKSLGTYASQLSIDEEGFKRLSKNLIQNYCSKNITVYSLKTIEAALLGSYKDPQPYHAPSMISPFVSTKVSDLPNMTETKKKEFDYLIKNFRAFCSWGGSAEDYRLLIPYLRNPFIMAYTIDHMSGLKAHWKDGSQAFALEEDPSTVQVACKELICRKMEKSEFNRNYPLSVGSTGAYTDMKKLYCHDLRLQEFRSVDANPTVKSWVKAQDLEETILETNYFISLITKISDPLFGVEKYKDLLKVTRSNVDDRWTKWSEEVIVGFGKDLLYEESLKIRTKPRHNVFELASHGFGVDFSVTLGEMDRLLEDNDKLKLQFNLTLSKNYLRAMRTKSDELARNIDMEGFPLLEKEVAAYLDLQLQKKQKLFTQPMWNQDFAKLIARELMEQVLAYRGPLFNSYKEEMITVPIKFSYGAFALGYLRYRADIKSGRLKLNL